MRVPTLCVLVLTLSTGFAIGAPSEPDASPARLASLKAAVSEILEETGTPGAGIALVDGDGVIWAGGVGLADVGSGEPVTADTMFRIGSVSKSFVALAALMLVEDGKLDLDATVRDLAPEVAFRNPWEEDFPVRVVHLLEHTTGWDDVSLREYAHSVTPPLTLREGLDYHPASRTSRWPPGRSMSYCNSGPAVAAYVIEKTAGIPYEDFVRERLFLPLGMESAGFLLTEHTSDRLATGYVAGKPAAYWHILMRPAGSINASPREMAGFVRLLANRGSFEGEPLLGVESMRRMETPTTTRAARAGLGAGYGLANYTSITDGFVFHGHGGGMEGFLTDVSYRPVEGLGYALMINASEGLTLRRIGEALRKYLTADLEPDAPSPIATVDRRAPERFAGYYTPVTPRAEFSRFLLRLGAVRVAVTTGGLEIRRILRGTRDLVPVSPHLFRTVDQPIATVAFLDDAQGLVMSVAMDQDYRRTSGWLVWLQWVVAAGSLLLMASSLIFALIWIPAHLVGTARPLLRVRAVPALSSACFLSAVAVVLVAAVDAIPRLGRPTIWSVSLCVLTWAFAGFAALGLFLVIRTWGREMPSGVRVHSLLVSAACVIVAAYLAYWGIIGLRSWT